MKTDTESTPLRAYDVADPAILIEQIAGAHRLTEGLALLALVKHPSTEQLLVQVEPLPHGLLDTAPEDLSQRLCDAMDRLPLPDQSHPIEHCVVTVVVRSGFTVFGRREMGWMSGWRYSNHSRPAFTGDLILVTEHGWLDGVTGWGGHEPRMIT